MWLKFVRIWGVKQTKTDHLGRLGRTPSRNEKRPENAGNTAVFGPFSKIGPEGFEPPTKGL